MSFVRLVGRWGRCGACGVLRALLLICVLALLATGPADAQFDSGSDGSDGALEFPGEPPDTIIIFDPSALGIDLDGDSIYHFTTIDIPAEVTLVLRADKVGGAPVHWLAQGAVVIDGTLDLNGEDGHDESPILPRAPSVPGPGGFAGGFGSRLPNTPGIDGFGPGYGCVNQGVGGGGSHATAATNPGGCTAGSTYGNAFLLPLIGGSGGAGGGGSNQNVNGSGGGAGGGAILIASSVSITVNGAIDANGGSAIDAFNIWDGGGGSGGAIRLVSPLLGGTGSISADKGVQIGTGFNGGLGRIRFEAFQNTFTGTTTGDARSTTLVPNPIILPTVPQPTIRIVSVDGVPAPTTPLGNFDMADITLDNDQPIDILFESENVPGGTTIEVTIVNESEGTQVVNSSPLSGAGDPLSANVTVPIPSGFSLIITHATWTP